MANVLLGVTGSVAAILTPELYQALKKARKGALGTEVIKWNFTKFLVDKQGNVVDRFAPQTTPEKIAADIERELAK